MSEEPDLETACEELGMVLEHLWELHNTGRLKNAYIGNVVWYALDTLKAKCSGLSQDHLHMLAIIERYDLRKG